MKLSAKNNMPDYLQGSNYGEPGFNPNPPDPLNPPLDYTDDSSGIDFSGMTDISGRFSDARSNIKDNYSGLSGDINTAYLDAQDYMGSTYQQQLQPQLQQTMNQLGARGMMDSSVTGDTLAQVSRGVAQDVLNKQAGLEQARAQQTSQLAGQQQGLLGQLNTQEAQTGAQLQASEYEMLANMLPFLLQNSMPSNGDGTGGTGGGSSGFATNAVTRNFEELFGRKPQQEGADYWTQEVKSGDVSRGNLEKEMLGAASSDDFVRSQYQELFDRSPEREGLEFWHQALQGDRSGKAFGNVLGEENYGRTIY